MANRTENRPFGHDHAAIPGSVRVRFDLAYDGTGFSGWARQPGRRTVQEDFEDALVKILRVERVSSTVAGRTDAGVHAIAQVAHVDLPAAAYAEVEDSLLRRLAGVLQPDVRVLAVREVSHDFDARFSALWRRYEYRLTDARHGADPLRRHDTVAWPRRLDVAPMAEAARGLLGEHDFAAFCRRRDGATTIRTLQSLDVERDGELIRFHVQADAFCHSMVRSLVGSLIAVGDGRQRLSWPASLLPSTQRASAVVVAPAHGLCLMEIRYPSEVDFAARAVITRNRRD